MSQPSASKPSEPVVIRPSIRLVKAAYYLAFALLGLYAFLFNNDLILADSPSVREGLKWILLALTAVLFLWTVTRHVKLRFTVLTVTGNKLRYESGMLSKSTRTLELSKVQDVGVTQSLTQRILGLGDISVETAGDSAPLTMKNVDRPQAIADFILESARG